MPRYVERDKVRPIPGAFGLERSKEEWQRRHRPDAMYLHRTGFYGNHLYIHVDEEYGYNSFLWVYPGTVEELVEDWCQRRVPWSLPTPRGRFRGEFDPVDFCTPWHERSLPWDKRTLELIHTETGQVIPGFHRVSDFDGNAHFHEEDDSYLKVDYYEVNGFRNPIVTIHVLDALAAI